MDINQFLKQTLPILDEHFNEERNKQIEIFKKIITSPRENPEFFKSPVNYLKKRNALTYENVKLPNGMEIPAIQDETLVRTIRHARELYKEGKLKAAAIEIGVATKKVKVYVFSEEKRTTMITPKAEEKRTAYVSEERERAILGKGRNRLEVDGKLIGPLVDPKFFRAAKSKGQGKKISATKKISKKK